MKPRPLTPRQLQVLELVAQPVAPSILELRDALGFRSTNAVTDHLVRLRKRKLLNWRFGASRTVRLTPAGRAALQNRGVPHVFFAALTCPCGTTRIGSGRCPNCGGAL